MMTPTLCETTVKMDFKPGRQNKDVSSVALISNNRIVSPAG